MARPVLLVVAHLDDADDAMDDLVIFGQAGFELSSRRFGALEVLPGETSVSIELLAERLSLVSELAQGRVSGPGVIVAPIAALMQAAPKPETLGRWALELQSGQELSPNDLAHWLTHAGYTRTEAIEQPGEFAVRGGIVDIFPPSGALSADHTDLSAEAIRIDYFGDEIESICRVDADSMASGECLGRVRLVGAGIDRLQADHDEERINVLDLMPDQTVVVLHELMELSEQARGYYERLTNARGIYPPRAVFQKCAKFAQLQVNQYSDSSPSGDGQPAVMLPVGSLPDLSHDAAEAIREVGMLAVGNHDPGATGGLSASACPPSGTAGPTVVILCQKPAERERLAELLREHAPQATADLTLEVAYLHRGFTWTFSDPRHHDTLTLLPHHELFHRYDTARRVRRISAGAAGGRSTDALLDLNVGDYVVHVEHGIARFVELKTMKRAGLSQEFLTLEFDGGALLHVPATQMNLVQKYIGGFQGRPPLSKLGGRRWSKQKEQVTEAVKDLAAQMLRVHAARASMAGIRYPADTAWQKEFEAEFPYDETEDQLAAIAAVKEDMTETQPMDRLICGDVGFGKTEVAIRAAFKAAEYGKQVAVLVPTTVLAEQHERTFGGRMADYPFRVESLSRFKTAGEQKEVLSRLSRGEVDVIIGTHRLLSKDVKFADLGLVIIDEEQRFGVEHKHKLMELRVMVDVLTLSATPIPRTLHMAMLGLRDISSLTTPPLDRRAIVTEVMPYQKDRIRTAIIRELNREGQVYFVHNRVHNIQSMADEIHKLVPDARIVIGHGQMGAGELEEVMLRFIRREADILVSTTIIESGLDIPTANTIFINQADHFGLADLHQLRGRVGRYKHRAYCYLLLPEDRPLTDQGARRLQAIEQYSMLGAGFKIAMRDLEIRGAGNLLGAEQSGHIASVGYELYCQLLDREAKRLRNEAIVEPSRTHLELPVLGQIPPTYIRSDKFRMDAYRRISRAATLDELADVVKSITDAYGQPPRAAQQLIDLTEIRIAASTLGVETLKLEGPDLIFKTHQPQALYELLQTATGRVSLIDKDKVYYRPPANYLNPPSTLLAVLRKLLVSRIHTPATAPA